MKYQLAVLVPEDIFAECADSFVQLVGDLQPAPSRILAVDHAKGGLGGDRQRRETLKAEQAAGRGEAFWATLKKDRHGHIPASFAPLAALHEMADEVRCSNDHMTGEAELWYASHRFKRYSVLTAAEAGMDAVLLVQFPDLFPPQMPEAMLKYLQENPEVAWCFPPVCHPAECGPDAPPRRWRKQLPLVDKLTPQGKIDEAGTMIRLAGLDMKAIAAIEQGQEPIVLMDELLKVGIGRGVAKYDDVAMIYRRQPRQVAKQYARKPPGDASRDRLVGRVRL